MNNEMEKKIRQLIRTDPSATARIMQITAEEIGKSPNNPAARALRIWNELGHTELAWEEAEKQLKVLKEKVGIT